MPVLLLSLYFVEHASLGHHFCKHNLLLNAGCWQGCCNWPWDHICSRAGKFAHLLIAMLVIAMHRRRVKFGMIAVAAGIWWLHHCGVVQDSRGHPEDV